MKTLAKAVAISSLVLAGSQVMAEDVGAGFDVSANVGLVSDYLFRGVSQSDNNAAIQGGFDVKHESGAYAGTWLSSLNGDYGSFKGDYADAEQDWYVGYGYKVSDEVSLDARYTRYTYISAGDINYGEWHAAATVYGATLGLDYSDDFQAIGDASTEVNDNTTLNYYVNYVHALPMEVNLSATYGRQDFKGDHFAGNDEGYSYWNLGVSKKLVGINFGLSYNNTSLSDDDCSALTGSITSDADAAEDACEAKWVLSATKSL